MNFRSLSTRKAAILDTVRDSGNVALRQCASVVSRRQFARAVAGTAVVGTTLASEPETPERIRPRWTFAPVPIPSGTPNLGGFYHVLGPGPVGGDPIDAEPSSITNFDGFVGIAFISGNVTRTNTRTGEQELLPFVNSDMRFMFGNFSGTDGIIHKGAFAFV